MNNIKVYVFKTVGGYVVESLNPVTTARTDELLGSYMRELDTPEVKEERKRFTVYREGSHRNWYATELEMHISDTYKEIYNCVSIGENEIIVNKDMLAKEWFNIFGLAHDGSYSSPTFERLIKNLGFKKDVV